MLQFLRLITLVMPLSYNEVLTSDATEHTERPLHWDSEHCTKNICIQLVAVAKFPKTHSDSHILGFTNNKVYMLQG